MSDHLRQNFLNRCGLSFDDLERAAQGADQSIAPAQPDSCENGAARMLADFMCSSPDRPNVAIARGDVRLVSVTVAGEILSMAELDCQIATDDEHVTDVLTRRYAIRAVALQGATVYTLLDQPPRGFPIGAFVPARGSVVLFGDPENAVLALRGSGVDDRQGHKSAWTVYAYVP